MHDGKRVKFIIAALALITFLPSDASAADDADAPTKTECTSFYDEKLQQSKTADDNYDEAEVKRLWDEGKKEESWKLALQSSQPLFEISDAAEKCGPHDNRFFQVQHNLCATFIMGRKGWDTEARTYYFEKVADPLFCSKALNRGDEKVLMYYMKYFLSGAGGTTDNKKAIQYIDDFVSANPDKKYLELFKAGIYRKEGDDTKALETFKRLLATYPDGEAPCQLSLYYRNGIGTEKNETEADKMIEIYAEHNPGNECDFINFDTLFEPFPSGEKEAEKE